MGKLIVLEGTDGSGKSTQFAKMVEHLQLDGKDFRRLVFPRYKEESSALIRLYLGGAFGTKPSDVNGYAASAFYAVDRFASYKQDWGQWYEDGGLVISDRYTTSNAVHQASKVPESEREEFFRWIYDLEHVRMELPKPDIVIYLDVPTELSGQMLRKREADTHINADIHEQHMDYLRQCRSTGLEAAEFYNWTIIRCAKDGKMRSIEDIHQEIFALVQACLEE